MGYAVMLPPVNGNLNMETLAIANDNVAILFIVTIDAAFSGLYAPIDDIYAL